MSLPINTKISGQYYTTGRFIGRLTNNASSPRMISFRVDYFGNVNFVWS